MKAAEITAVKFEYTALPDWVELTAAGAAIPADTQVCFAVQWKNTGDEDLNARVFLTIVDPEGGSVSVDPDVYYLTLGPDESTWIYFDNVVFTGTGTCSINGRVVEYGESVALDSFSYPVTVGAVSGISNIFAIVMPIVIIGMLAGMMIPMTKAISE